MTAARAFFQKNLYFAKFRILQLLLKSWFSVLSRELGNFAVAFSIKRYHYNIKTSQKTRS